MPRSRTPVLVVDDHALTRQLIRDALTQQGFKVLEAADGPAALAAAPQAALILLDLRLADRDAFILAEQLRAATRGREVPLLAVSGVLAKSEEARIAHAGFDDVIAKPVDPLRLLAAVRAHLPSPTSSPEKFGGRRRLVVADDDAMQRKLACFRLARLGFEVTGVADGHAALEKARELAPVAIISDVLMPGLDGFGLCVAARNDPQLARIPIILMTNSYVDAQDRELAHRAGAHDLLFRTPELDDIIAVLRTVVFDAAPVLETTTPSPALENTTPSPALDEERMKRALSQLDRQVALNATMTQRVGLLSAELSVLHAMADALARQENTDEALRDVLAGCLDAGGISIGALYLTPPWRGHSLGAPDGIPEDEITGFFGERAFLEGVMATRRPVVLDERASGAGQRVLDRLWAASAVIMPLHHRGVVQGALFMVARTDEMAGDDRVAFAQAVASQVSQALAVAGAFAEKEAAARAAREQATILRAVLASLSEGVVVAGAGGELIHENPAARAFLGDEGTARALLEDRSAPIAPEAWPLARALAGEHVERVEVHLQGRSLSVSAHPLREEDGARGGVMVMRDVTGEKAAAAHLMVSDRMASIGMLAAGMAHEINNPLAAVVMSVDLAIDQDLPELAAGGADVVPLAENLRDARAGAARVAEIVRDLKIFSRSEEETRAAVDVRAVMASSIRMARNELRHRARVIEDYGQVPPVLASESRLGQVFLNLLVNAAQALPDGKADKNQVRVSTRLDAEGRVVVEVADTGAGIPPEVLGRLFTPFFTTKRPGVGTGLGLTICQRIIYGLGGEIEVETELGKGTLFRVRLPGMAEVPAARVVSPPVSLKPRRRGKLLVIDDDPAIIQALRQVLVGEHDVTTVTSAPEALRRLQAGERFDVILCDLMMPVMTGMELHDELARTDPATANEIVFMTGGAFSPGALDFLEHMPNQLVEKPFDLRELKALLAGRI